MDKCGFCKKAKEALADEIKKGQVIVMSKDEAKKLKEILNDQDLMAFPLFVNLKTGKKVKGFTNKEKLMKELNEHDSKMDDDCNKPITFYNMETCPFCKKAMEMFKDEIASGAMVVRSSSEANGKSGAFPYFERCGKNHTGLPKNKAELLDKLKGSSTPLSPGRMRPSSLGALRPLSPGRMRPLSPGRMKPDMANAMANVMVILFYQMGCPFCEKAADMFRNEIKTGLMLVLPSSQAPNDVMGFPHFVNAKDMNKSHTGLPQNKDDLTNKLKLIETYTSPRKMVRSVRSPRRMVKEGYRPIMRMRRVKHVPGV